jgi:hypothetical protein
LDERETFIRRTLFGAAVVGAAGVVVLLALGRLDWMASFGLGAAISLGNFHMIVRAVRGLTQPDAGASRLLWKGAIVRFALVAALLVFAVAVLHLPVLALLAGLVVTQLAMVGCWLSWALGAV